MGDIDEIATGGDVRKAVFSGGIRDSQLDDGRVFGFFERYGRSRQWFTLIVLCHAVDLLCQKDAGQAKEGQEQ